MVIYQLKRVAIASRDNDVHLVGISLNFKGGDDVICFKTRDCKRLHIEGGQHIPNELHLPLELCRSRCARGLVLRKDFCAKGNPRDVKGNRHMGGLFILHEIDEHRRKAIYRVRDLP